MKLFSYKRGKNNTEVVLSVRPEKALNPKSRTGLWLITETKGRRFVPAYSWRFETAEEAQDWLDEEADFQGWRFHDAVDMPEEWQ